MSDAVLESKKRKADEEVAPEAKRQKKDESPVESSEDEAKAYAAAIAPLDEIEADGQAKEDGEESESQEDEKDKLLDPKDLPAWCKDWAVPPKDATLPFQVRLVDSEREGTEMYDAIFSQEEYARRTHEFLHQASKASQDYPLVFLRRWLGLVIDDDGAGPSGEFEHTYGDKYDALCRIYAYLREKEIVEQPRWQLVGDYGFVYHSFEQGWNDVAPTGGIASCWFVNGLFDDC